MSNGPRVEWRVKMSVGVAVLDDDHRHVIAALDSLFVAHRSGGDPERIAAIIDTLIDYADDHFEREEDMLRAHRYPGLRAQELAHQTFATALIRIRAEFKQSPSSAIDIKLATLLKDWLISHILGIDQDYKTFLSERGIS